MDATDFEFNEVDSSILMFCTKKDIRHITVLRKSIYLGTVTPDAIDFDCEPYCKVLGWMKDKTTKHCFYQNYKYDLPQPVDFTFTNPHDSFRSLLTSKGCDLNKKYVIIKCK